MNASVLNKSGDKSLIGNTLKEERIRAKENTFYRTLKEKLDVSQIGDLFIISLT
jgi:hypothetical protein